MNRNHSDKGVPLEVTKNDKLVTNLMSWFLRVSSSKLSFMCEIWHMKHSNSKKRPTSAVTEWLKLCGASPTISMRTVFAERTCTTWGMCAILSHLLCSGGDIKSQWPPASLQTQIQVPALMRRQRHLSHGIWNTPTNSFGIAVTLGECTVEQSHVSQCEIKTWFMWILSRFFFFSD